MKQASAEAYVQGLSYFCQLLIFPADASAGEVLSSLWKYDTMRTLLTLPFLAPEHSFSSKIASARVHFLQFTMIELTKEDNARSDKLWQYVNCFLEEQVLAVVKAARIEKRAIRL